MRKRVITIFIAIFACIFLITALSACSSIEDLFNGVLGNGNNDTNGSGGNKDRYEGNKDNTDTDGDKDTIGDKTPNDDNSEDNGGDEKDPSIDGGDDTNGGDNNDGDDTNGDNNDGDNNDGDNNDGDNNDGDDTNGDNGENNDDNIDDGENEDIPSHYHSYDEVGKITQPTCTTAGGIEYVCSCGDVIIEPIYIDPNAHNEENGFCVYCGVEIKLEYLYLEESDSYAVVGIGTETASTDIVIPDTYQDKPVTHIKEHAFFVCDAKTITVGNSVTTIEKRAFDSCWQMTDLILGNSVKYIGYEAFDDCSNMVNISIPNSVMSVGQGAFNDCDMLKYNEDDYAYYLGNSTNPYVVLIKVKDRDRAEVEINENTRVIYARAFAYCKQLVDVTLPNSVVSIGNEAFTYNWELTNVIISDNIDNVGIEIFSDCKRIRYNQDDNAYYLGSINNPYLILVEMKSSDLTEYEISRNTRVIYADAFKHVDNLNKIIIPNTITDIGSNAFSSCDKLVEVYNLSSIDIVKGSENNGRVAYYALDVYNSISEPSKLSVTDDGYKIHTDGEVITLWDYVGGETEIVIPNYVTAIHRFAFYYREDITSIDIPESVTNIDIWAFAVCRNLVNVILPNSIDVLNECLFYDCVKLPEITIPDSVTQIGSIVFAGCESLVDVKLSNTLESIGEAAFSGCINIKTMTIPATLKTIAPFAFQNCYRLVEVYDLSPYLTITIGENNHNSGHFLGGYVLDVYTSLEEETKLSIVDGYILHTDGESVTLVQYIGEETVLVIPYSVTAIYNYAFVDDVSITSVVIPDTVLTIGENAFYRCYYLETVTIGSSVTSIGDTAFYGCNSLVEITLPRSVAIIGRFAIGACESLTTIYCEVDVKPEGWDEEWNVNNSQCTVIWGELPTEE